MVFVCAMYVDACGVYRSVGGCMLYECGNVKVTTHSFCTQEVAVALDCFFLVFELGTDV